MALEIHSSYKQNYLLFIDIFFKLITTMNINFTFIFL